MKVQDPNKKHPPFDVPAGLAQGYVKVEPAEKKPTPNLQWAARQGVREGEGLYKCRIFFDPHRPYQYD